MRTKIFLVLAALAIGGGARAESTMGSYATSSPAYLVDFGFGFPIYSNEYTERFNSGGVGWSLNADVLSRIGSSDFLWGVDLALNFFGFSDSPTATPGARNTNGALGIAPLITVLYRFAPLPGTQFTPRFGLATGPQLYLQRSRYTNSLTNQADTSSNTSVRWQTLARPGIEYGIADSFGVTFEGAFGLVGSDFILQPSLRLAFLL